VADRDDDRDQMTERQHPGLDEEVGWGHPRSVQERPAPSAKSLNGNGLRRRGRPAI
jgi:hypothetical protein